MKSRVVFLAMGLLVGGAMFAAESCGKASCGPANCGSGCCDAQGVCQLGNVPSNCGSTGTTCNQCLLGQGCTLGVCTGAQGGGNGAGGGSATGGGSGTGGGGGGGGPSCLQSCGGCCDPQGCKLGTDTAACGSGGATCAACTGSQTCTNSMCKQSGCVTCVSGGTCVAAIDDTHCGAMGITCNDCTAHGGHCNTGTGVCQGGSCNGCFDSYGVCQTGDAKGTCGKSSGNCATCSTNQICQGGSCVSGAGGGGGGSATGGGTGTGGGGTGTGGGGSSITTDNCSNPGTLTDTPSQSFSVDTSVLTDDGSNSCSTTTGTHDAVFKLVLGGTAMRTVNVGVSMCTGGGSLAPSLGLRTDCMLESSEVFNTCTGEPDFNVMVSPGTYYLWIDAPQAGDVNCDFSVSLQ